MLDGPAGENATTAAAGDKEIVRVDVALGDNGVDAAVQIEKIVARIGMVNEVGKFFAVAGAAARIGVENDVAAGSQHLFFKVKTVAIVGERTAVNLQNKGILFGRIEIRRVHDPTLNLAIVL